MEQRDKLNLEVDGTVEDLEELIANGGNDSSSGKITLKRSVRQLIERLARLREHEQRDKT